MTTTTAAPGGFPSADGCCYFVVMVDGRDAPVATVEALSLGEGQEFFEAIRALIGVDIRAAFRLETTQQMLVGIPRFGRPYLQMLLAKAQRESAQLGQLRH